MFKIKKLAAHFAAAALMISCLTTTAFAATSTQDGLTVKLDTDKTSYSAEETIDMNVEVENTNPVEVENVTIESVIPDGFEVVNDADLKLSQNIAAGDKVSFNVKLKKKAAEPESSSSKDDSSSAQAGTTSSVTDSSSHADNAPKTGDSAKNALLIILFFTSVAACIVCVKNKKGTKVLSMLVCVSLLSSTLGISGLVAFAADAKSFEVVDNITFDGKDYDLTVKVTYDPFAAYDISLTTSENEFLTSSENAEVYFYASVSGNADSVLLIDDNKNILAEMKDDGLYTESGDDIENDGIFSCKLDIDLSEEKDLSYYAVVDSVDGLTSNVEIISIVATLTAEEIDAIDYVDTKIYELKSSEEYIQGDLETRKTLVDELLTSLADEEYVIKEANYIEDDQNVYAFAYKCGINGAVVLYDFDEETNGADRDSDIIDIKLPVLLNASEEIAGNVGKAVVLNAFEDTSFRRDYYFDLKTDWDEKGLDTTVDTQVDVTDLKELNDYDVVVFSGHGIYLDYAVDDYSTKVTESALCLNETLSSDKDDLYTIDLKKSRITRINGKNGVYAALPALISDSYKTGELSGKFIFSESCEFLGKDGVVAPEMKDAFIGRGASAVVGFNNSVLAVYSREFMKSYVDGLIDGELAINAFNNAKSTYGDNDGQADSPAVPYFFGDDNAKLVQTGLLNGGFEEAPTPVKWKTFADVRVITKLGELKSTEGKRMAMLSTGIGAAKENYISGFQGATQGSIMQQTVKLSDDVSSLSFDYNMISEEPPEFVGTKYDDKFVAEILDQNGDVIKQVANESVNESKWIKAEGFKLTVGQKSGRSAWQTGWKTANVDMTEYQGQTITIRFLVFDCGDSSYDSAALIDNVVLK